MLEDIKLYLKLDHDEEDNLLKELIGFSKEYLKQSGCKVTKGYMYKLAIKLLVSYFYENRNADKNKDNLPNSLQNIIIQLKYCK